MAPRNASNQIIRSIQQQQADVLQRGKAGPQGYNTIRQRHLFSTYHFTVGPGLAVQLNNPFANIPTIQPGVYSVFKAGADANAQGLPQGFQLTDNDTNFIGAGRVPDQQNFSVWEVGVAIGPQRTDVVLADTVNRGFGTPEADDVDRFQQDTVLQVTYITEEVPLGAVREFAQPGGPHMSAPSLLSATQAAGVFNQGGPSGALGGQQWGSYASSPWSAGIQRTQGNGGNVAPAPSLRRKLDVPIFLSAGTQFSFDLLVARPIPLRSLQNLGTAGFAVTVDLWVVESYRPKS